MDSLGGLFIGGDICDTCKKEGGYALQFCRDCEIRLCSACQIVHARIPILKDHRLVSQEEGWALSSAKSNAVKTCSEHPYRDITLYCTDCEQAICSKCTSQHKRHGIEDIELETATTFTVTCTIKGQQCELDKLMQKVPRDSDQSWSFGEDTITISELHKILGKLSIDHIEQASSSKTSGGNGQGKSKSPRGPPEPTCINVPTHLSVFRKRLEPSRIFDDDSNDCPVSAIGFSSDTQGVTFVITAAGGAVQKYCYSNRKLKVWINHEKEGNPKHIVGVGVLPNRNLVLSDSGDEDLKVYSGANYMGYITMGRCKPRQLAVMRNGKVAVCCGEEKCINIYADLETSCFLQSQIKGDPGDGIDLVDPRYISAWESDGLVVSDVGSNSVLAFRNVKMQWRWKGFSCPGCLCTDGESNIIVTDLKRDSFALYILNMSQPGIKLRKLYLEQSGLMCAPRALAIHPEFERLLMVGQADGSVKVVSLT